MATSRLPEYESLMRGGGHSRKASYTDHSFNSDEEEEGKFSINSSSNEDEDDDRRNVARTTSRKECCSERTAPWSLARALGVQESCLCKIIFFTIAALCLLLVLTVWGVQDGDYEYANSFAAFASKDNCFDYIVVGGGPSGIIVSVKLAKLFPNLRVLLLESGTESQTSVLRTVQTESGKETDMHLFADEMQLNKFDIPLMWSGVASSQGRRQAMQMEESWSNHHWPIKRTLLGRALGGSGLLNAMINVRSLPTDFERWNATGWTFENILPHYMALESYTTGTVSSFPDFWEASEEKYPWRGYDGPVTTALATNAVDYVAPLFVKSALASGIPLAAPGFNHPDPQSRIGVGYYEFTVRDGVRDSVAHAFLGSDMPSNLVIRTGITVTRILMEASAKGFRAVGVEYVLLDDEGVGRFELRDNEAAEVILAAGAILTPQLLSNSGIGENGAVINLPGVGKNCQDHPVVAMAFELTPEASQEASSIYTVGDEMEDYCLAVSELEALRLVEYNATVPSRQESLRRLGTLATSGFSAGAFLISPWAEDDAPDIQLTVFPRVIEPHVTRLQKKEDELIMRSRVLLVTVALLRPDAKYVVRPSRSDESLFQKTAETPNRQQNSEFVQSLESRLDLGSPLAQILAYRLPVIEVETVGSNYLSERDTLRLAWGMEQVRRIRQASPLSDVTREEMYPGAQVRGDALKDYIRANSLPNSHWVGTTRIGDALDGMAVVDAELRVHGSSNLRIVDAGVIPSAPNGNTHSTVCVVASRGADLIAKSRSG